MIFPSGCSAEGQRGFSKRSFSSVLEKKCPKQIPNSAGQRPTSSEGLLGQEVVDFLFSRDLSQSWAGLVGGETTVWTPQIQNLNWERPRRSSPQVYEDGRRCLFSLPIPVSLGRKAESEFLVTLQNPRFLDQMNLGKHWQNKVKEDSSQLWFSTGHWI